MARIYREMEDLYQRLPANGKPDQPNVFTVLAGFVAVITSDGSSSSEEEKSYNIISLATGTKCVSEDMIDQQGVIIHDSHAEVLARRGFIRYLTQILLHLKSDPSFIESSTCPLQKCDGPKSLSTEYQWKSNWQIYLCISDSPCGDATIYSSQAGNMTFTGAKLVNNQDDSLPDVNVTNAMDSNLCQREFGEQQTSAMRLKTGRSDIRHRSQSKSCSDKICRWRALGLQGQFLFPFVGKVLLTGVVVASDPYAYNLEMQREALQRALIDRISDLTNIIQPSFIVHVLSPEYLSGQFLNSKSNVKRAISSGSSSSTGLLAAENNVSQTKIFSNQETNDGAECERKSKKRKLNADPLVCVPCSFSINWYQNIQLSNPSRLADPIVSLLSSLDSVMMKKKRKLPVTGNGFAEITVAQTGLLQGSTLKSATDPKKADAICSRLSKRCMSQAYQLLESGELSEYDESNYERSKKRAIEQYPAAVTAYDSFFSHPLFVKWHNSK